MVFLGLIFALAAAIWLAIVLRHGGVFVGCLLVLATGSVLGHAFFNVSIVTIDRLLLGLVCVLYFFQRFHGDSRAKPVVVGDLLLGAFLIVLLSSTLTHDWKYEQGQPVARLLFLNLMPAALYWMVRQSRLHDRQLKLWLVSFVLFGLYLALTGIAEVAGLRGLVFPRYIASTEHAEFLGRARGPYLNPVANGLYIATSLSCVWMLWPRCRNPFQRALVLAASAVLSVGALLTLTRCVWLGVACSFAMVVWLAFPRGKRVGTLLLLGSLAGLSLGIAGSKLNAFKRDKNVSVADMSKSASLRPMLAAVAWQIFKEHPITGVGYGHYTRVNAEYIATREFDMPLDEVRLYHQHNVSLAVLTETGLAGLVPYLAVQLAWAFIALRLWRDERAPWEQRQVGLVFLCCLVNYAVSGLFHDVLLIPMMNTLLFFLAGLATSIAQDRHLLVPFAAKAEVPRGANLACGRQTYG